MRQGGAFGKAIQSEEVTDRHAALQYLLGDPADFCQLLI